MKTLWLMVCDDVQAKIYSTACPPKELTLTYHQVNFGGPMADFASSLGRMLNNARRAGTFDGLAIMASSEFLAALDKYLNADCRGSVVGSAILESGQHTHLELVSRLSNMLTATPIKRAQNAS